jgi:hypothetical protein
MNLISTIALFCLLCITANAAENRQPADFDHAEPEKRLVNRIQFPDVKGNASAMISCFSQIATSGRMKETGCYAKDNFESSFAAATMQAAKKASLNPAIIDGRKRKVYVQFRVEFIAKDDNRDIFVYSNPGYAENLEAYGYQHIAAQRTIGKEEWQDICPQKARFLVVARAFVGEDGQAGSVSLEHVKGIVPTVDCQNAIRATILQSLYTPAMAEGYPVPSSFIESFGN